jgi:NADPH:quinone reductase-like Zn-dependent oxidoreductase/uncharacterized membrane protein
MTTSTTSLPLAPGPRGGAHHGDWLIPAALVALSAVPTLAGVIRLIAMAGGGATLPEHARFAEVPLLAMLHIVGATGFALLGALQFSPGLRRRHPQWHRAAGWALAPLGAIGALSGMAMAVMMPAAAHDSLALTAIRLAAGSATIVFLLRALSAARRKDFTDHGRWMTRAYALGIAGGTQVFTMMPWAMTSAASAASRAVLMGAGWVINALVAEWVIRGRAAQRVKASEEGNVPAAGEEGRVESMMAVVQERYGGPEVLRVARVARPSPAAGQVRIRVHATSVNAMDYRLLRANPFLVRLQNGLFRPKRSILGADVAGVVEALGPGTRRFEVGDEVFGHVSFADGLGGFAEHVCMAEEALVPKPASIGFVEAAAVPLAGITALQAIRERARVASGSSVLIHGAGGGVGMFLVQIAKAYGAHVTAVCGPGSVELVRSLGADRVVDYTRDDVAQDARRYDAIFGVNGFRSLGAYRALLAAGGTYVMVGGAGRQLFEALIFGKLRFALGDRKIEVLTIDERLRARDLEELRGMLAGGTLRAIIDRVFPLEQAADAIRYVEVGHVRGKVVLAAARA